MSVNLTTVLVAEPAITDSDGVLSVTWPTTEPDVALMHRDVLTELLQEINLGRAARKMLDGLAVAE